MDPFTAGTTVAGAIHVAGQVKDTLLTARKEAVGINAYIKTGSLIDVGKLARVEPICLVDADVINLEYTPIIMQSLQSIFSGYYLQAISLTGNVGGISIASKLAPLNPNRDKSKEQGVINELTAQILIQDNENEKNYLKERIAKISGGIATIRVGGITPSEVEEKIARIDDSVCAVRSAKDGVVAGGGIALLSAYGNLSLDDVTSTSIQAPFLKIISNAGCKVSEATCADYPMGYDVKEYKEVNMFDAGIIDTVKGVKNALANAASASNNLLRTNFVMPFKRTENGK